MKTSILIISFFLAGVLASFYHKLPTGLLNHNLGTYILYLLMFVVGITVGSDTTSFSVFKNMNRRLMALPLLIAIGSLALSAIFGAFSTQLTFKEGMAVGAGFGYYSLSSGIIGELHSPWLGTIALLANVSREILTLLVAPFWFYLFGKYAPVASGGATAMDTTLPIITKVSGTDMALVAVFSGVVLTIIVPFLVTFILNF